MLFEWCSLKEIVRLDNVYLCHESRVSFLVVAAGSDVNFAPELMGNWSDATQLSFIRWLVSRNIRVKHLFVPVEIQSDVKLMSDLFHLCGSSLRTVRLQNDIRLNDCGHLLNLMIEHCGNLEELTFTEWFPDNPDHLQDLSLHCTSIQALTLRDCRCDNVDTCQGLSFSALRTFEASDTYLSNQFLDVVTVGSPLLEVLVLRGANNITPEGLKLVAFNCPLLHTVSLSDATATDANLLPMVKFCRNLRSLEVLRAGKEFTNLSFLRIAYYSPLLTRFRMENCCNLATSGAEGSLKDILIYCRGLRDLTLECCTTFDVDTVVQHVAKHCRFLTHLTIKCRHTYSGCGLRAVAQACACLKHVTFVSNYPLINLSFQDIFPLHIEVEEVVDTITRCEHIIS